LASGGKGKANMKKIIILPISLFFVACVWMGLSIFFYVRYQNFLGRGVEVEAIIINVVYHPNNSMGGSPRGPEWTPTYQWNFQGETYTKDRIRDARSYAIGETYFILIDQKEPDRILLYGDEQKATTTGIWISGGLMLVAVAVAIFQWKWTKAKSNKQA